MQEELERNWQEIYRFSASLLVGGGLQDMVADEVAIFPGMEDVMALMKLNEYARTGEYDVIVLDCPPTGEALRFVSITTALEWYVGKRLKTDRRLAKLARPLMGMLSYSAGLFVPDDRYFATLEDVFNRIKGVDALLHDPKMTTVRLVTNAEKMVIRETKRAFMYFSMYGMTIDGVIINKIMPPEEEGYFSAWARIQHDYVESISSDFHPVPVTKLQMFPTEVCGIDRLEAFAQALYGQDDASRLMVHAPALGFRKLNKDEYVLEVALPFAPKEQIDVSRPAEDLIIRIGTFKRNVELPRSLHGMTTAGARMENGKLVIHFKHAGKGSTADARS